MTDRELDRAISRNSTRKHRGIPMDQWDWMEHKYKLRKGSANMTDEQMNTDLNAMHEVESTLTDREQLTLVINLYAVVKRDSGHATEFSALVHPTARQRREAYLRTKGLWEDE